MNIKPILFSTPMVQAILAGKKSMTRRVIPEQILEKYHEYDEWCEAMMPRDIPCERSYEKNFFMSRSRYKASDILWVRETWQYVEESETDGFYVYAADNESPEDWKWRPSIFMPKEAARIFLRVTDVRVERLQDITEEDVFAEGAGELCACPREHTVYYPQGGMEACYNTSCSDSPLCPMNKSYPELFGERVWNETIKKSEIDKYGWEANPWVLVIEFEWCEKPDGF